MNVVHAGRRKRTGVRRNSWKVTKKKNYSYARVFQARTQNGRLEQHAPDEVFN